MLINLFDFVFAVFSISTIYTISVEYLVFGETSVQAPTMSELLTTQLFSGWCKVTIEMPVTAPMVKKKE